MVKTNSEYRSIRKKLMAAIAMVLVASIMVVSSSYAWFTLSTAPEVKGITTSVGSNGNLEMALRTGTLQEISTSTGLAFPAANTTWGNLVDLSYNDVYHLDQMELRPARLNVTEDAGAKQVQATKDNVPVWQIPDGATYAADTKAAENHSEVMVDGKQQTKNGVPLWIKGNGEFAVDEAQVSLFADIDAANGKVFDKAYKLADTGFLKTPEYGADGRVSQLLPNTINGVYNENEGLFMENTTQYGIRAVGVNSDMSPEEAKLNEAKRAVGAAISNTKTTAQISLRDDSVKLADIAVAYALKGESASFTQKNVDDIKNAITTLQGIRGELEAALKQAVVAVGAYQEKSFSIDDVTFTGSDITVEKDGEEIDLDWTGETKVTGEDDQQVSKYADLSNEKADLLTAYAKLSTLDSQLSQATDKLPAQSASYTFAQLKDSLATLLDTDNFKVIDSATGTSYTIAELRAMVGGDGALTAVKILLGTPTISIESGAYYTVAEFSGNYSATTSMTVTGSYGGISLDGETITVVMATAAVEGSNGLTHYYLPYIVNWISGLTVSGEGGSGTKLITDKYGYVVDLAFRTNATGSSLQLQTTAANRVADSTATQGGGSYMEFAPGHPDFTLQQVANLMQSIRVVFTDEAGSKLYGIGMLDVELKPVYAETKTKAEYDVLGDAEKNLYKLVPGETDLYAKTYGVGTYAAEFIRKETTADALFKEEGVKIVTETGMPDLDTQNNNQPKTAYYELELVGAELSQGNSAIKAPLVLANFTVSGDGVLTVNDAKANSTLVELPVNTPVALSTLVYLDGDTVENGDVAISGSSMNGTMNLQFASDAPLDPMDYTYKQLADLGNLSVAGDTLTIPAPASNGDKPTSYDIYVDNVKVDNIAAATSGDGDAVDYVATTYSLAKLGLEVGSYKITVVGKAYNYADSKMSAAVDYVVSPPANP